jgi:dihydroorotate dehydrogenase (NAD+) catalytic subunit
MILNGNKVKYTCSSGALGFDGKGYFWEQPFRWLGLLNPQEFTIITKTLTLQPRKGNLRWWCPWRTFRFIEGGTINAISLTNPGIDWWIKNCYPKMKGTQVIPSVYPHTINEATEIVRKLDLLRDLTAIEFNLSCPNTSELPQINKMLDVIRDFTDLPVIVKLGWSASLLLEETCQAIEDKVAAFDLINAVPWYIINKKDSSPLSKYGFNGGVSGEIIRTYARDALLRVNRITKVPIISGGGIFSKEEADWRFQSGADAVSFGTLFLRRPWMPNKIVQAIEKQPQESK